MERLLVWGCGRGRSARQILGTISGVAVGHEDRSKAVIPLLPGFPKCRYTDDTLVVDVEPHVDAGELVDEVEAPKGRRVKVLRYSAPSAEGLRALGSALQTAVVPGDPCRCLSGCIDPGTDIHPSTQVPPLCRGRVYRYDNLTVEKMRREDCS